MESIKYFNNSMIRNHSPENVVKCTAKIDECFSKLEELQKEVKMKRRSKSPSEIKSKFCHFFTDSVG